MRVPLFALITLLSASLAQAAPCPSSSSDLTEAYETAVVAFYAMDLDTFNAARDNARIALSCLEAVVSAQDAAAYHRLEALDGFAVGSEERTVTSFRRAHALDPDYDLPPKIAPAGHPLRVQFERAADAGPPRLSPLRLEQPTWVDGEASDLRPRDLPAVFQVGDADAIHYSGYLMPGMPPPSSVRGKRTLPVRRVVAGSAGAVALAGGLAFLGASLGSRGQFRDPSTAYEDLHTVKRRANRQFFAFEALTFTALGLGGVAAAPDAWMPAWMP
ncbi:MAG: hypothetical protein KC912_02135 [Proteobacteria bacterium]|nr:hypothetical protein [Pseudomonadota bacterium]